MQKTNVVPLYQKLIHENAELDKNEATIADLAIPPNAVVEMVAFDQGMDDLVLSTLQGTPIVFYAALFLFVTFGLTMGTLTQWAMFTCRRRTNPWGRGRLWRNWPSGGLVLAQRKKGHVG
jgi:hypothetical protein